MHTFKEDKLPKKNLLSMQIDLSKFEPASDAEKQQHRSCHQPHHIGQRLAVAPLGHNAFPVGLPAGHAKSLLSTLYAPARSKHRGTDAHAINRTDL